MCLVLSRCGFDLSSAEWSLSYTESLTSASLPSPLFLTLSLCSLFCSPPPTSESLTSILTSFCSNSCFVPSVSYISLYLPPLPLLSFALQASELGMLSVYYTYIFTSLVSKWKMVWASKGNIGFRVSLFKCCVLVTH